MGRHQQSPSAASGVCRRSDVLSMSLSAPGRGALTRNVPRTLAAGACILGAMTLAGGHLVGAGASRYQGQPSVHHSPVAKMAEDSFSTGSVEASVTTTRRIVGHAQFQVGDDFTQHAHLASDAGGVPSAVRSAKNLLTSL